MYMTDLRHLTEGSPELPLQALKLREFFGQLVRVATADEHVELLTGVPCKNRIQRKACSGLIVVKKIDVPATISWMCDHCKDSGEIRGFEGSWYDLTQFSSSLGEDRDDGDQVMDVELTYDEYKAWISGDFIPYDPDSMRLIYRAYAHEEGVVVSGWEGDLDILSDAVAADANHETKKSRQKLMDSIFTKIDDALSEAMSAKE
jgi:hypothetical protein